MLADAERDYEDLCNNHISILAEHLAAFDNAALATGEREYEQMTGTTFLGQQEEVRGRVDRPRGAYERARAVARQIGVADLPL